MPEIPAQSEPPIESGGVGDFNGKKFLWMMFNNYYVEACFESGEFLKFRNSDAGWAEFWGWGLVISKMI